MLSDSYGDFGNRRGSRVLQDDGLRPEEDSFWVIDQLAGDSRVESTRGNGPDARASKPAKILIRRAATASPPSPKAFRPDSGGALNTCAPRSLRRRRSTSVPRGSGGGNGVDRCGCIGSRSSDLARRGWPARRVGLRDAEISRHPSRSSRVRPGRCRRGAPGCSLGENPDARRRHRGVLAVSRPTSMATRWRSCAVRFAGIAASFDSRNVSSGNVPSISGLTR